MHTCKCICFSFHKVWTHLRYTATEYWAQTDLNVASRKRKKPVNRSIGVVVLFVQCSYPKSIWYLLILDDELDPYAVGLNIYLRCIVYPTLPAGKGQNKAYKHTSSECWGEGELGDITAIYGKKKLACLTQLKCVICNHSALTRNNW